MNVVTSRKELRKENGGDFADYRFAHAASSSGVSHSLLKAESSGVIH